MRKFFLVFALIITTPAFADGIRVTDNGILELYLAPPRRHFDWSTPRSTAFSFLGSRLRAHELNPISREKTALGHGMIHVSCNNSSGTAVEFWTGITGQDNPTESTDLVLKEKIGMGIMFHNFKDGFLQKDEDVHAILSSYYGRSEKNRFGHHSRIKPKFLQYGLSSTQCDEVESFFNTFKARQYDKPTLEQVALKKPEDVLSFGLTLDPYNLYLNNQKTPGSPLGGGCTSFATSFLKVANVFDPGLDDFFLRTTTMTKSRLIGSKENPVPLESILLGNRGTAWLNEPVNSNDLYAVTFYDPEKIYDFIDGLLACSDDEASTMSSCDDTIQSWKTGLEKQGSSFKKVTREVQGSYQGKQFSNTLEGVRIN